MQNIDVTQETKAKLRANKNELEKNHSKKLDINRLVLTKYVLEICKTES